MDAILEFFGLLNIDGKEPFFVREPEGPWSWQHIVFVSVLMVLTLSLAVYLGKKNRHNTPEGKNKVLIVSALLIDGFELVKIIVLCIRYQNPWHWLYVLPLFLCSIQLIAIPMAAFCKGRVREACLDFVLTFGILGGTFGTVGATQIYAKCPVIAMDSVFSAITHSISAFASVYIAVAGMISMKKKNFPITMGILLSFAVLAYIANRALRYNYMFLMYHDGTPYSIFYDMVGGSPVLYPLVVVAIFVVYLSAFYAIYHAILKKRAKKAIPAEEEAATV